MPVNGFLVNNTVQKYNYESLENYNTPDFSTSSTYQVGDYVMYQGKLYICTLAVTTAGAWNSIYWTQSVLSEDLKNTILVQGSQPNMQTNKIWIPNNGQEEVQVPTWEEFNDLKSATTASTNAMQTTLLECLKNAMWDGTDGAALLQAYCTSIGLAGWIDVKPKTAIDGTTGNLYVAGTNRQTSDYIDVSGFASMTAILNNDSAPYEMWYAVRCYDANKAFLGAADPAGTVYASTSRAFPTGTAFVRLMFTPNVNTHPNDDLAGIYTGHTIDITLVDASANSTVRRYYLSEVDDFASA